MRLLALVIGLAGCIDAGLVPCGDLACPVGTECGPSGGCFAPGQLAACEGIDEGLACDEGFCISGVCVPAGCGNHAMTPDEVCDDGNTNNGDGCSADCRSDEQCGNGIADFAAGEQCDDGNDVSGDECEPGCLLPRCGDGLVDGIEECDPASELSTTRTCEDFGYYAGTLACNDICRLDPTTGCSGRCGDGIVQPLREDCDGGPPARTCLDYGFDLGALACSAVCAEDPVRSCDRYGWEDLGMAVVPGRVRADGDVAIVLGNAALHIYDANGTNSFSGIFVGADVRDGAIVRATTSNVDLRAAGASAFTALPAPTLGGGKAIVDVGLGSDGAVVALVATGTTACEAQAYSGGTWTTTPTIAGCQRIVVDSATNFVATTAGSSHEWTFPGGPRTITAPGLRQLAFRDSGTLDVHQYNNADITFVQWPQIGPTSGARVLGSGANYMSIIADGDVAYAIESGPFSIQMYRHTFGRREQFDYSPTLSGAPTSMVMTRQGHIYATSDAHLFRFEHLTKTVRVAPSSIDIAMSASVSVGLDGTLVYCGSDLFRSQGTTWQKLSASPSGAGCPDSWARSANDIYAQRSGQLYHYDGANLVGETLFGTPFSASFITGDATTTAAITSSGILRRQQGGSGWIGLPGLELGCTAYALAVRAGVLYAAGGCTDRAAIWKWNGSAWIELYARSGIQVLSSIVVRSDATIFASNGMLSVVSGTEGGTWTLTPDAAYVLVLAGDRLFGSTPKELRAWDGARWSPIRSIANAHIYSIAAGVSDVLVIGDVTPIPTVKWQSFVLPP